MFRKNQTQILEPTIYVDLSRHRLPDARLEEHVALVL